MEKNPALRVDPEEDEIFFYEITEKEAKLKGRLQEKSIPSKERIVSEICSEENNRISEIAGLKSGFRNYENDPEILVKLERIPCPESSDIGSNVSVEVADLGSEVCKDKDKERTFLAVGNEYHEEVIHNENEKEKDNLTITSVLQERDKYHHGLYDNDVNIQMDHNYSTPVRIVIDKSIFKTPKSVVKADKDGGFLTVLSEIALVKAEVDESASTFPDLSGIKDVTNEGDKENIETTADVSLEVESIKLFRNLAVEKVINENKGEIFSNPSGVRNESAICNTDYQNNVNDSDEQNIKNKECSSPIGSSNHSEAGDVDSDEIDVIFEKLAVNTKKPTDEVKIDKPHDVSDLIKLDSFIDKPTGDDDGLDEGEAVIEEGKSEMDSKKISEINILDEALMLPKEQKDECIFAESGNHNEEEHHKKFLRRKTMRLLEELNEIVSLDNGNKDSDNGKATLSEEAAKVIQKLKAVALDDSIQSPDQYFDLDNLNETFFSNEVSDILNDTLSKPLDLLTNKDIAVLLEKINGTAIEEKFNYQMGILDAEKENFYQNKMKETFSSNKQNSKSNKTPLKFVKSEKSQKTPLPMKNNTPSVQIRHQTKFTPSSKCLSEIKKPNLKPLVQSNENRFRAGIRTAEKAVKSSLDTRIPKLTSTTSKLTVGRFVKIQNKTPNRLQKIPKNLKFDNIESPVQAYINSKTPVLISKVKGKAEPELSIWPKQKPISTKTIKPETEIKISRNEPKLNLPYVKYRSAIPFKLEKAPESRLPRLAPKMQKLILGNSPVVAKHTGRIPLTTPNKSEPSIDESSIVMKPNEISIIVTKAALQSNVNK